MADPSKITDLLPRRPSALIAIGALGGFSVVLVVALLLMIAATAPDEIQFVAMDQPAEATATPSSPATPVEEPLDGFAIASANGCVACHSVDGAPSVGPSWLGSFGTERDLEGGAAVPVDEEYLRRAILDPRADVAAGFPDGVMPATYGDSLSDQQIDAIVGYIVGLSE